MHVHQLHGDKSRGNDSRHWSTAFSIETVFCERGSNHASSFLRWKQYICTGEIVLMLRVVDGSLQHEIERNCTLSINSYLQK